VLHVALATKKYSASKNNSSHVYERRIIAGDSSYCEEQTIDSKRKGYAALDDIL
jgi:hypothetical protein